MTTKLTASTISPPKQQGLSPSLNPRDNNSELEIQIDAAARKIIETPMPLEERKQALSELLKQRAQLLTHVPVNGLKGSVLFLNMAQIGLAPTPLCPYYNKMRVPTVSTYQYIGGNIASIKLDPSALEFIPKHILDKAGDLSGKQVELFWTAIDGRFAVPKTRPLNLCTHPWTHPSSLKGDDVKRDVRMGIFPEIGFEPHQGKGAIAINNLSPMEVYTHIDKYSPDNAHFEQIPDSPFGVLWSVTEKDNRVGITKMLVIFDYSDPISAALITTIRNCDNLDTHLTRLSSVQDGIQQTFARLLIALETEDPSAIEELKKLPLAFQNEIFKQAWIVKNSPTRIHGDFGKASFLHDTSLGQEHYCTKEERILAVRQCSEHLKHLLFDSQIDLLANSQTLVKGDNVLKMMRCAQLIGNDNLDPAYAMFEKFDTAEKEAVFFAMWEVCKCPRGNSNFGSETFMSARTSNELKKEALLLAASRQTPKFDLPIVEAPREPVFALPQPVDNNPIKTNTINSHSLQTRTVPEEVKDEILTMIFDPSFTLFNKDEQAKLIVQHMNRLDVSMKNEIYKEVYLHSQDPLKGGPNWGELHIADDMVVLTNALLQVI